MTRKNAETNDTAAGVAAPGATVAPEKPISKKPASPKKGAPKGKEAAAGAKPGKQVKTGKKKVARQATPRTEGKGAKILEMIGRTKGASLTEIMTATGWQAHSVRGFISTAGKKHNRKIESVKNDSGDRIYRLTK
jgi:Protein of unknown function (DUF3489)